MPSFSETDSLLYFDNFFRLAQEDSAFVYSSHLDSVNEFNTLCWSDPIQLPQPMNFQGSINAMPSINHGGDTLFFCSNRDGTRGGIDIWLSIKANGQWSNPVNLGDSINSANDEFAPCYSPFNHILYFDSYSTPSGCRIYSSLNRGLGEWDGARPLPEIINIPGNYNYGPYYDDYAGTLYFTSARFQDFPDPLRRADYINGNWDAPVELGAYVNGFWRPNVCNLVTTENASLSADGNLLFYDKHVWERYQCIDFFSYLFYSRAQGVGIEADTTVLSSGVMVNIYPNPSNDQFIFWFGQESDIDYFRLYDIRGRFIKEIRPNETAACWDCTDFQNEPVSSGVYFAVYKVGDQTQAKKLTYLR